MDVSSLRRAQKIFILMSQEVKTRSADQCRSHHQKIMKYHHTIDGAIKYFSEKLALEMKEGNEREENKVDLQLTK